MLKTFPIRFLKKRLKKEQILALTADRFAKTRVEELKEAIKILTNHKTEI